MKRENKNLNKLVKSIRFRLNDVGFKYKEDPIQIGKEVKIKHKAFSNAQILDAIQFALNCVNSKQPYSKFTLEIFSTILFPILEHGATSKLLYSQALLESGREQACREDKNIYCVYGASNMMLDQAREEKDLFYQALGGLNKDESNKWFA